jgi:endonuclease/exonuclease/phosphatase family metal-dependent hydrolase
VRLLTYNLLAGDDGDALERFAQATALLRDARPDVLVLNECNLLARDGQRLRDLETALSMQARLAPAASGFHVALLLRDGTFDAVEVLQTGFAHVAMVARVTIGGRQLKVIGTHLNPYSPGQRLQEAQRLLAHVEANERVALLGDLNAISPRDAPALAPRLWVERYRRRHQGEGGAIDTRAIATLEAAGLVDLHAALHMPTRPTRPTQRYAQSERPAQRLDYIFASRTLAGTAVQCSPYLHAYAQTASDHLPVYADLAA